MDREFGRSVVSAFHPFRDACTTLHPPPGALRSSRNAACQTPISWRAAACQVGVSHSLCTRIANGRFTASQIQ